MWNGGKSLLALDGDCDCHWVVVVHGSGGGVVMMAVIECD